MNVHWMDKSTIHTLGPLAGKRIPKKMGSLEQNEAQIRNFVFGG